MLVTICDLSTPLIRLGTLKANRVRLTFQGTLEKKFYLYYYYLMLREYGDRDCSYPVHLRPRVMLCHMGHNCYNSPNKQ